MNSNICYFITQRCASLSSLVIHNDHISALGDMARMVIDKMVCSPANSKDSIKLSLDKPLNNHTCLNMLRPGVLRQYFGRNVTE